MEAMVYILIGAIIGMIITRFIMMEKPIGTLRVDQSDPDSEPYLFLELTRRGADEIQKKRYVRFKVTLKNYISHE